MTACKLCGKHDVHVDEEGVPYCNGCNEVQEACLCGNPPADAEKAGTCPRCGYDIDSLYHRHDCIGEARKQIKSPSKPLHLRLIILRLSSPLIDPTELLVRDFELNEEYV